MSGGGFIGLCFLGVLDGLEKSEHYQTIRNISGTSIGALFALMFALRIPAKKIYDAIKNEVSTNIEDKFGFSVSTMLDVIETKGLIRLDGILSLAQQFVELQGFSEDFTFRQLSQKTGINLYVTATDIITGMLHYFSVDHTPDTPVMPCVKASMSIPLVFPPVKIPGPEFEDSLYVDGCVQENLPVGPFLEDAQAHHSILGVYITPTQPYSEKLNQKYQSNKATNPEDIDFLDYIAMVMTSLSKGDYMYIQKIRKSLSALILINKSPIEHLPLDTEKCVFNVPPEVLEKCFLYGQKLWFQEHGNNNGLKNDAA